MTVASGVKSASPHHSVATGLMVTVGTVFTSTEVSVPMIPDAQVVLCPSIRTVYAPAGRSLPKVKGDAEPVATTVPMASVTVKLRSLRSVLVLVTVTLSPVQMSSVSRLKVAGSPVVISKVVKSLAMPHSLDTSTTRV